MSITGTSSISGSARLRPVVFRLQLERDPLSRSAPSAPELIMSTLSKVITGFCAAGFAAWFVMVVLLNGVHLPGNLGLFLWISDVWVQPVFFVLLAWALALAVTDLVRVPDVRTPVNIGVAVTGLIGLILGAWRSYVEMVTPSTGPAL